MNRISSSISRLVVGFVGVSLAIAAGQDQEPAVSAEVWSYEIPENLSAKSAFERWRSQNPGKESEKLKLDGLSIPARETNSMVRVAGVLTAPVTGLYAFGIQAPGLRGLERPDETELWIQDERTGEWKLAQSTGNPVKTGGRTQLEAGVPRRFELWTMGRRKTEVEWHVTLLGKIDPATGRSIEVLPRQTVPATAIGPRMEAPDDKLGDGLPDSWQLRHGMVPADGLGQSGPWGDPDGDFLPNWREHLARTDPNVKDAEDRAGLVRWETWRDVPGRYVFDLRRAAQFPTGPHEVRYLDRLEIPAGIGDHCGSRLRGWLVAPTDGEYRIGISAEDEAELWLGENESWESKRLIAKADQKVSGRLRWFQRDAKGGNVPLESEQTGRVTLKAGVRYYLEILHKQDTGPDFCFAAWIRPGLDKPEVISSKHLVSWKPCPTDTDDDGLPDAWQNSAKLTTASVDPAMRQAEADPDLDGATNREEWRAGTDPLSKTDCPPCGHLLTSEAWTGIDGRSVTDLTESARFPAKPDLATRIDNLDFGREGQKYGVRLRGFITAPQDGDYRFSISGNNACLLYLAPSEDKFTKRVISRVEVGTKWRSFTPDGLTDSGPLPLEKDKRYYIEVIYKRDIPEENKNSRPDSGDHSSVAWMRPGQRVFSVIPPGAFSSYQADPRDLDDDDLPDDWERANNLDPTIPSGKHGAWGDPDGDGLENFREFQLGLDPHRIDVHGTPGLALWEMWDNRGDIIPAVRDNGDNLSDLIKRDERFPLQPVSREWRDALESPRRQGTDFGARLRAQIVAPATGDYVFSIAARDIGELFLSKDASKFSRQNIASVRHGTAFRSWDKRSGQMSKPIHLESGKTYYLEVLFARGPFQYNDDFLSIAWKPPGAETFSLISAEHLVAFFRDPNDQDDDELPNDWEKRYGLDTTDPHGDHGPDGDPDRDGLNNMREYQLGSDPRNGDSDGDGVSDHDEIHVYGSDPLVKDLIPPVKVADLDLTKPSVAVGSWHSGPDGTLISPGRLGAVDLVVDILKPGLYLLRIDAVASSSMRHVPSFPLVVGIDGRRIGLMNVTGEPSSRGWLTPSLAAGRHIIRLENRNTTLGVTLEVLGIQLLFHEGSAPGDKSAPAWLTDFHTKFNRKDDSPDSSAVSPVCIEGVARHPDLVSVSSGGLTITAAEGLTGRWFANVPLATSGSTRLDAIFDDGAHTETCEVTWAETNLFTATGPIRLRVGDSLKVLAQPENANGEESASILLNGVRHHEGRSGDSQVVTFEQAGNHVLTASVTTPDGARTARLEVSVIDGHFGSPAAVPVGASSIWSLPSIGRQLEVEADPAVSLREIQTSEPDSRRFEVFVAASSNAPNRIVARLPGGGAVLDAITVPTFRVVDSAHTLDSHLVNVLPDGTRVVEIGILIEGNIPPDLLLRIKLIVPDAVFSSGETSYELRAGDFDQNGVARLTIFKAPGKGVAAVCHTMEFDRVQDDKDTSSEE